MEAIVAGPLPAPVIVRQSAATLVAPVVGRLVVGGWVVRWPRGGPPFAAHAGLIVAANVAVIVPGASASAVPFGVVVAAVDEVRWPVVVRVPTSGGDLRRARVAGFADPHASMRPTELRHVQRREAAGDAKRDGYEYV